MIARQATSSLARKLANRLFIFKMSERFVDVGSVDNFIAEQENQVTLQKPQGDVKLLQTFLATRNELRKVEEMAALELNEYTCEFIISVRTKDGKNYEPSSLRSLVASFERHLNMTLTAVSVILTGQLFTPQKVFTTISLFGVLNGTATNLFVKAWFKRRILHAPNQILTLVDSNEYVRLI